MIIDHVTMVASDLERSSDFYERVLGMERVDGAGGGRWLGMAGGGAGTRVRLVEARGAGRGRAGIGGVHHTAFGTGTDEALLRWKRRLTDQGVPVSGPYDRGYFTSLYFRDPDGQVLEIATAGPGYAIDEPADALGGELMLPPRRIVRGHRDEAAIAALTHPEAVPQITREMELSGIHHVSGITDDLAGMGALLERALGLSLIKKTTNRDDPNTLHYFWAGYDGREVAPHSAYTLFGWPTSWNHARPGAGQTLSITFRAPDAEALATAAARLAAEGIATTDLAAGAGLTFTAPDGQGVEVVG